MKKILIPVALFALAISGFAQTADAARKPPPQPREYDATYEIVFDRCLEALGKLGWNLLSADQSSGIISARTPVSALTWGDHVIVYVSRSPEGTCRVVLSSASPGQVVTWGKNKKNKKRFYNMLDELMADAPRSSGTYEHTGEEAQKDTITPSGTCFFVTSTGYCVTNYHVVDAASSVYVLYRDERLSASIIGVDKSNDLALLKVDRNVSALPLLSSSKIKVASVVFTLGFPNTWVQGIEPKYTSGEINSLSGLEGDLRFFQISTPLQPGNSGGPLCDSSGRVVGITTSTLDPVYMLTNTSSLPQNVNYALKSNYIVAFLQNFATVIEELPAPLDQEGDALIPEVVEKVKASVAIVAVAR